MSRACPSVVQEVIRMIHDDAVINRIVSTPSLERDEVFLEGIFLEKKTMEERYILSPFRFVSFEI